MTSLEFIEKEIKQLEKRKEQAFKNEYYSVYKECSQKITTLQQIKSILEAWEVVKSHLLTLERDYVIYCNADIGKSQFFIVKKALEAEE